MASPEPRRRPAVLFVNRFFHPDESATSQLLSDLAFHVADRFDVTVVASRLRHDDPTANLPAEETIRGVRVRRVASTRFGRAGLAGRALDLASFYVTAWFEVLRLAQPGGVIVAKTDPPLLSILGATAARLKGARLVNWLQDLYPEVAVRLGVRGLDGAVGRLLTSLRDISLRAARTNVVLGGRMAEHLAACGVPGEKIAIAPNWSDEEDIRPLPHADNPLRAAWGLQDRFVVLYSGNLGRAHEYGTALAAARLLADDPRIRFVMIGSGHLMSELRSTVEAEGLRNIEFRPFQPQAELARSLAVGDVHWLSLQADMEGLIVPSKAYGILAAGRPIIAVTDPDGEIARLVRDHQCGVQVTPGDGEAMAAAIRAMAGDPALTEARSTAARRASEEVFSRRLSLEAWSRILQAAAD